MTINETKDMVKGNKESVRNHSAISLAEIVKWSNTLKGKPGIISSWKDDRWCREAVDKKPCVRWNNNEYHKKMLGVVRKARLGSFIGYKIQWESFL